MRLDFETMDPADIYSWMIQTITPRPIAWILSDNGDATYNLAPFSYFNAVTSRPPILSFSAGKKRGGEPKDTVRNIEERQRFVLHIATAAQADAVNASSESLPFGASELSHHGIATVDDPDFGMPRVEGAPVAMLCEHHQTVHVGDTNQSLVLGRIRRLFVEDTLLTESPEGPIVEPDRFDPLARLGGDNYATLGTVFSMPRP